MHDRQASGVMWEDPGTDINKVEQELFQAAREAKPDTTKVSEPLLSDMGRLLQEAIQQGEFALRGTTLGNKWARELKRDAKLDATYKKTPFIDKKQFRIDWCKKELDQLEVGKTHSESFRKITTEGYRMRTFGKIAEEYGFLATPKVALTAANKYCRRCIAMGGDWLEFDEWGEICLYSFSERGWQKEFEECWKQYERESSCTDKSDASTTTRTTSTTPSTSTRASKGAGDSGGKSTGSQQAIRAKWTAQCTNHPNHHPRHPNHHPNHEPPKPSPNILNNPQTNTPPTTTNHKPTHHQQPTNQQHHHKPTHHQQLPPPPPPSNFSFACFPLRQRSTRRTARRSLSPRAPPRPSS